MPSVAWVHGYSCSARISCGTFHFYLAPVLNPSAARTGGYEPTCLVFGLGAFSPIVLGIPIVGLILTAEIQQSIYNSALFQRVGEYGYLALGFRSRISASSCPKQSRSSETLKAFMANSRWAIQMAQDATASSFRRSAGYAPCHFPNAPFTVVK